MSAITFLFITLQVLILVTKSYQECYHIYPPQHGKIIRDYFSYQVTCDPGYILHGERIVHCENNEWSSPVPRCIQTDGLTCERLSAPENGQITCDEEPLSLGKNCRFKCNDGYQLRGSNIRVCMIGHKWFGLSSTCVPVSVERSKNSYTPRADRNNYEPVTDINNPCYNHSCEQLCRIDEYSRPQCKCKRYYILNQEDQKSCKPNPNPTRYPVSPCGRNNGGCAHYCSLTRQREVFCSCRKGYVLDDDKKNCIENTGEAFFNPCLQNKGGCEHHCSLTNENQVFCYCEKGYTLGTDRKSCLRKSTLPVAERLTSISQLASTDFAFVSPPVARESVTTSESTTRDPSAISRLQARFSPCAQDNGGCQHLCDSKGRFVECSCKSGYRLDSDGKHCFDINECVGRNLNGCHHYCHNTEGNYFCSCKPGYVLVDGHNCEDIDECLKEDSCQHYCHNNEGSYTCSCKPGYILVDGHKCEGCRKNSYWSHELQECESCPQNSHTVSEGSTSIGNCICDSGFIGSPKTGITCEDIDECRTKNFGCSYACVNIPGNAYCICPEGFMLDNDNKTCIDIDECSVKNGGCEGLCINEYGTFRCVCLEGYTTSNKDFYTCDDVNECAINNGGCEQKCINYRGGFHCACDSGYRLDRDMRNCIDIQCPALPVPPYSNKKCKKNEVKLEEMSNYPIETACIFKCAKGYKISGVSNTMECLANGTWQGELPECKPMSCDPLDVPENGDVHPSFCSERGNLVTQKCTFTCHSGYVLKGSPVLTCQKDLSWKILQNPTCHPEKIRPRIDCPEDIITTLMPGKNTQNITLPAPKTNMDNYKVIPATITVGSPFEFPSGVTKVVFTASSLLSNKTAKCDTTVTVLDKEPPVFEFCPDPIVIEDAGADGAFVTWDEPVVTDNVEVEVLYSILKPNTTLAPGTHVVVYMARDNSGNTASCSFDINVIRMNCSDLVDPEHGKANCMDWMYGKFCQPECDVGYTRHPDDPMYYSCDDTGVWEPSNVISKCLQLLSTSISCPDGYEMKRNDETSAEFCVECPSTKVWSAATKSCEETS